MALKQTGDANPKRRKTLLMVKEQLEEKRAKELKRIQDETPTKSTRDIVLGEILWILRPLIYCKLIYFITIYIFILTVLHH